MPKITDVDHGPQGGEGPLEYQVRRQIGSYAGRLQMERIRDGLAFPSAEVMDYIIGFAGTHALRQGNALHHYPDRTNAVGSAKSWVAGYFEWYCQANPNGGNHLANRDDVGHQPDPQTIMEQGELLRAQREYRDIPWTQANVTDDYGLWRHPDISDAALDRINMNLRGETVQNWGTVQFRADVFGRNVQCHVPTQLLARGVTLEIGGEIYSDWVEPKDAGHGHPMTTLRTGLENTTKVFARLLPDTSGKQGRLSYEVVVGPSRWVIAYNDVNPKFIVTFFKKI